MTSTPYKFPHQSRVAQGALKETVLCSVLQLLAFIAVWLRLWSRRIVGKRLEFNDYAIFVALFLTTSLLAIAITSTVWSGKGFHTHDIDPAYRNRVWVAFTAGQPVWGAGNTAIKFSILHLYLVLFQDKMFRRACYASMVISSCYFISVVLETFLVCKPVQYNWNKNIRGTCTKHAKETYLTAGILNLLIDIFIVALPLPVLFRLRIPTWKKFGLIAVFSVGTVICVVSLLRVLYISRMDIHDFHYTYAGLGMWSIVEPQLGIINACMPVMRPLLNQLARTRACQRWLPANWFQTSFQDVRATPMASVTFGGGQMKGPHHSADRLYPMNTVDWVKDIEISTHISVADSGVNLERGHSGTTFEG